MTTRKLFICEKPDIAKKIQFLLNEKDLIILSQPIGIFKFNYQDISFSEAPYTKEKPKYKIIDFNTKYIENSCITGFNKNGKVKIKFLEDYYHSLKNNEEVNFKDVDNFFNNFNEIIVFYDPDYTGVRGVDFKFSIFFQLGNNYLNYFEKIKTKLKFYSLSIITKENIKKTFNEKNNNINYKKFFNYREQYLKKDFFEYNYNLNSLLFFSKFTNNKLLTKNMIQTLIILNNNQHYTYDCIFKKMEEKNIGSIISRLEIIKEIFNFNLIEKYNLKFSLLKTKKEKEIVYLKISKKGQEFINNNLHKKIKDPHLTERLNSDIFGTKNKKSLSFEDFYNKYEQYLYTVFSKQKRFLNKEKADN